MKVLAHIEIDASPETKEHAQHVIDNWAKFCPLDIEVLEVVDNS